METLYLRSLRKFGQIESEVAKIDKVKETKVIFSPIRKNFGEKKPLSK